jgi:sulfite exporter TauE/SafE
MCGGIVMAYSTAKVDTHWTRLTQISSHILYSLGRVLTYTILGVMFGYLGGVATFSNSANGILLFIAGIAMVLTGASLLGKIKFLTIIEHSLSANSFYQNTFKAMLKSKSLTSFFILGMLNGLMPCGFVYFFAITAASTASPFWGGVVMMIFGLSTIPAMFSLGYFVGIFKQSSFRALMIKLAAIAVVIYGLLTIYNGYGYITDPTKTLRDCH